MASNARKQAEKRGHRAEALAALYLRLKGYRILARNLRTPMGEIDIIAHKSGLTAFVEVKARANMDAALSAVSAQSWQRISRAADYWMARHPHQANGGWRYDIIAVSGLKWPQHLQDAWRPGLA